MDGCVIECGQISKTLASYNSALDIAKYSFSLARVEMCIDLPRGHILATQLLKLKVTCSTSTETLQVKGVKLCS